MLSGDDVDEVLRASLASGPELSVGADQLGGWTQGITSVEYALVDARQVLTVFAGDVTRGTTGDALVLPRNEPMTAESIVLPAAPEGTQWGSARLYDRGLRSAVLGYDQVAPRVFDVVVEVLAAVPGVEEPAWEGGSSFDVVFAAVPITSPSVELEAAARDRILLDLRLGARQFGNGAETCDDLSASVTLDIELRRFPHLLARVSGPALLFACATGERVGLERYDRANDAPPARFEVPPDFVVPPDVADPAAQRRFAYEAVYVTAWDELATRAADSEDFLDALVTCRGRFGGVPDGGGGLEPREAVFASPHVALSGLRPEDDRSLVLGFDRLRGIATDARDTVAVLRAVDVTFAGEACPLEVRRGGESRLAQELRAGLPMALRDGILELVLLDPVLTLPGALSNPDRALACNSDSDCNPIFGESAAYGLDGAARGVRHRCLARFPPRAELIASGSASPLIEELDVPGTAPNDPGTDRFCHVQLEPRRLNLRPSRLEVVLSDEEGETQSSLYEGSSEGDSWIFWQALAVESRPGVAPAAGEAPQPVTRSFPIAPVPSP